MLDFGSGELVVIGVVALVAIGPKELPGLLRTIGQAIGKLRRMAGDFQNQFNDAMREADMADAQKMISDIKSDFSTTMTGMGSMSPPIVMPSSETTETASESTTTDTVTNDSALKADDALALGPVDVAEPVGNFSGADSHSINTKDVPADVSSVEAAHGDTHAGETATPKTQVGAA